MVAPWRRDSYVLGGGVAEVALIALSPVKLPDPLPVSRGRHGMPDDGDGAGSVGLVARDRAEDPAWFDAQVLAPFADLIATDLETPSGTRQRIEVLMTLAGAKAKT